MIFKVAKVNDRLRNCYKLEGFLIRILQKGEDISRNIKEIQISSLNLGSGILAMLIIYIYFLSLKIPSSCFSIFILIFLFLFLVSKLLVNLSYVDTNDARYFHIHFLSSSSPQSCNMCLYKKEQKIWHLPKLSLEISHPTFPSSAKLELT